jgi:amidophosphoribosyltransferase
LEGSYVLASETCALDMIGASFVREIENGEIVVVTRNGLESIKPFESKPARPCVFEYIYFARPDSIVSGRSVYDVRQRMGRELAAESPAEADVVVPIPDSGVPAALGFAERAGLPFGFGIIRNHYIGRTFIQPEQRIRELGVRRKHAANAGVLRDKRIVLIDDSVVRGTTSRKIVELVREAGAREVHMRIASPPITHSDYYGIDTPQQEDLLAARNTVAEMCRSIGADSLAFLSVAAIYRAIGIEGGRNAFAPQLADHCFTGEYPTPLPDLDEFGSVGSCC